MSNLGVFLSYCLAAAFAVNPVMAGITGIDTILDALRKPRRLIVLCVMVTFISILSSVAFYPIDLALVGEENAMIIRAVIYSVIMLVVFFILDRAISAVAPGFYKKYGDLTAPACFNGMAVGVPLVIAYYSKFYPAGEPVTFMTAMAMGVGAGLGFSLAAFLIHEGLRVSDNPDLSPSMRGAPIMLIYIGILSLAFCAVLGDISLFMVS